MASLAEQKLPINEAHRLFKRAAEVGLDQLEPLSHAQVAEREYLHHLTIAALLRVVGDMRQEIRELRADV